MFCENCGYENEKDVRICTRCNADLTAEKGTDSAYQCVRPHLPKKHCTDCNKELPGSSISDVCAMCTIRRRNREVTQERKAQSKTSPEPYERYDRFERPAFTPRTADPAQQESKSLRDLLQGFASYVPFALVGNPEKIRKYKFSRMFAILFPIFMGIVILNVVSNQLFQTSATRIYEEEQVVSISAVQEDTPPFLPQLSSWESVIQTILMPIAQEELNYWVFVTSMTFDSDSAWVDGAHFNVYGNVVYNTNWESSSSDVPSFEEPFELCVIITQYQYIPIYLAIGSEVLYDYREYIDTNGLVTESGADYFEQAAGTPAFDEEIYFLEDLIAE